MHSLIDRYQAFYGYRATVQELYALYTQGALLLNRKDENTLLTAVAKEQ